MKPYFISLLSVFYKYRNVTKAEDSWLTGTIKHFQNISLVDQSHYCYHGRITIAITNIITLSVAKLSYSWLVQLNWVSLNPDHFYPNKSNRIKLSLRWAWPSSAPACITNIIILSVSPLLSPLLSPCLTSPCQKDSWDVSLYNLS